MVNIVEEQKKRIRYMYTWMFRRYRTNTLADGGSIRNDSLTKAYLKMAQDTRMSDSIKFAYLSEAGIKEIGGRVSKLYGLPSKIEYGSELIVNGDFSSDASNWVSTNSSLSVSSNRLLITATANTTANAYQGFTTVIGKTYRVSVDHINGSSTGLLRIGDNTIFNYIYVSATLNDSIITNRVITFVATSTISYILVSCNDGINGHTTYFDNISIKEVLTYNATQTTPTSRPYLTGNIAPNEKLGLKNPNGGSNYMTHPTISFAANEAWSVTTVLNWNGNPSVSTDVLYGGVGTYGLKLKSSNSNLVTFVSANSVGTNINYNSSKLIGKLNIITLVASNGTLKFYINGILFFTSNYLLNSTTADFSYLLMGRDGTAFSTTSIIKSHIIRSQALTQQQVTAEYTYLRSVYPEIESVDIGTQTWATSNCEMAATPQGNVIQEMQLASNVERMTNTGTDGNTDWIDSNGDGLADGFVISSNDLTSIVTGNGFISRAQRVESRSGGPLLYINPSASTGITAGKTYRIRVRYRSNKALSISLPNISIVMTLPANTGDAIYASFYHTPTTVHSSFQFYNISQASAIAGNFFEIDEWSVQEVGWVDSQNLYDYTYSATAGTVEQKTYAAVKAAAMWCHYNNDIALGATYGKLYNWYAVKLLQMDIDYFNAANPTTPWGWRVPTQADFDTLATTLGGAAIAGGKMKMSGTTYWGALNVGSDNASGFSAVAAGRRTEQGVYDRGGGNTHFYVIDSSMVSYLVSESVELTLSGQVDPRSGRTLRLIKTT